MASPASSKAKELPTGAGIGPTERTRSSMQVQVNRPFDQEDLSFSLQIPTGWAVKKIQAESAELRPGQLKPLAVFERPPQSGEQAWIIVQALDMAREIRAAHWLLDYCVTAEAGLRQVKELSHVFADSFLEMEIDGYSVVGRAAVRITGKKLFLVLAVASESLYPALSEALGLAIASFAPASSAKPLETQIESRTLCSAVPGCSFEHPASWKLERMEYRRGDMAAVLRNPGPGALLQGVIGLRAMDRQAGITLKRFEEIHLEELSAMQIKMGRLLDTREATFDRKSGFATGKLEIREATLPGSEIRHEVWTCSFRNHLSQFIHALISPHRVERFPIWAVNKRAFDIVSETFRAG